jgi:ABC-type multidrug transport system fused ATPase/permease subunit
MDVLDAEPEVLDEPDARELTRATGRMRFDHVRFRYRPDLPDVLQRQLVAFARALVADPRILILDEATSSVDISTERTIERAFKVLLADRTAFVIAHRLSTIRHADLIVVLEHGRVVEQGKHDELLARRGFYTSLYTDPAVATG